MTATNATPRTDETVTHDLPADVLPLGVDGADSAHLYTRREHTILVETPAGAVERRVELGTDPDDELADRLEKARSLAAD